MSTLFRVVDLTQPDLNVASPLQAGKLGAVDLDQMRSQLTQIRDALSPVLEEEPQKSIQLQSIELDLTVGLEGQVWFVAKGTAEASLRLIWSRD